MISIGFTHKMNIPFFNRISNSWDIFHLLLNFPLISLNWHRNWISLNLLTYLSVLKTAAIFSNLYFCHANVEQFNCFMLFPVSFYWKMVSRNNVDLRKENENGWQWPLTFPLLTCTHQRKNVDSFEVHFWKSEQPRKEIKFGCHFSYCLIAIFNSRSLCVCVFIRFLDKCFESDIELFIFMMGAHSWDEAKYAHPTVKIMIKQNIKSNFMLFIWTALVEAY